MRTIGVGLIGLGRHGKRYAKHLLEPLSGSRLVAVSRRNVNEGRQFEHRYGIRFYQDYHELIADPRVQAVLVVTAPSLTLPIARAAIAHGKPLLIEKPLALEAKAARELVEAASRAGVPVMTAHTLRYEPVMQRLQDLASRLAPWQYLALTARLESRDHSAEETEAWLGRGALMEIGIHLLDLVRFLTGEEVASVYCETVRPSAMDAEEQVWARLTTPTGVRCLLDVSRISGSRTTRAEIIGRQGQASADWTTSTVQCETRSLPKETFAVPPSPTIPLVLHDFFHALAHRVPLPITGVDGLRAVELAEACYRSAAIGRSVSLVGSHK